MAPRKKGTTKKAAAKKPAPKKAPAKRVMSDDENISEGPSTVRAKRVRRNPPRGAKKNPDYYISSAEKPVKTSGNTANPDEDERVSGGSSSIPTKRAKQNPVREASECSDDDVSTAEEGSEKSENNDDSGEDDLTLETPPSVPTKRARKNPDYYISSAEKGTERSDDDGATSKDESSTPTKRARKSPVREESDSPDDESPDGDYVSSAENGVERSDEDEVPPEVESSMPTKRARRHPVLEASDTPDDQTSDENYASSSEKSGNTDNSDTDDYIETVSILPSRPMERKKWPRHDPPITNPTMVPEGWDASDCDINEFDLEANIKRCHERISEGILPAVWGQRLERYLKMRDERRDVIKSWPEGLSLHVIQRLESLKKHKALLEEKGDHPGQLANIIAIMEAYKTKRLDCMPSMVSVWIDGTMVGKPEMYNPRKMQSRFEAHGCPKNWWVEAWEDPRPGSVHWVTSMDPLV